MRVLVTGSSGLIGSEAAAFYASNKHEVIGIDNNLRAYFFGKEGDTSATREYLKNQFPHHFIPINVDIRNREKIEKIFFKNYYC